MKLRNKVFAGFAATVLTLSMMVGTALASTRELPFEYPNEANAPTDNDVWVKLIASPEESVGTREIADITKSVDIVIAGKCSFDAELIFNSDLYSWLPTAQNGQTVDGELTLNMPFDSNGCAWAEVVVSLKNKTEGPLAVTRMDWKDEAGNITFTWPVGAAEAAPAEAADDAVATDAAPTEAAPKTGVESFGLLFGLGAAVLGSGAVVLKRKEK